ncbi:hypothetical protein U1Q18_052768 [Sarracenia purpurea var. burkii]
MSVDRASPQQLRSTGERGPVDRGVDAVDCYRDTVDCVQPCSSSQKLFAYFTIFPPTLVLQPSKSVKQNHLLHIRIFLIFIKQIMVYKKV